MVNPSWARVQGLGLCPAPLFLSTAKPRYNSTQGWWRSCTIDTLPAMKPQRLWIVASLLIASSSSMTAAENGLVAFGPNNITHVYRSPDPLDFGGVQNADRHWITSLAVAAPEIISYEGQDYIAALNPKLDGIRIARLTWTGATASKN